MPYGMVTWEGSTNYDSPPSFESKTPPTATRRCRHGTVTASWTSSWCPPSEWGLKLGPQRSGSSPLTYVLDGARSPLGKCLFMGCFAHWLALGLMHWSAVWKLENVYIHTMHKQKFLGYFSICRSSLRDWNWHLQEIYWSEKVNSTSQLIYCKRMLSQQHQVIDFHKPV